MTLGSKHASARADDQAEGGIIDDERSAVFLVFHPTSVDLHRDLLGRLGRYQVAVSTAWAKDSMRLGTIQNAESYKVVLPSVPSLHLDQTARRSVSKRSSPAEEKPYAIQDSVDPPAKKVPKLSLDPSNVIKRKSQTSSSQQAGDFEPERRNNTDSLEGSSADRAAQLPPATVARTAPQGRPAEDSSQRQTSSARTVAPSHRKRSTSLGIKKETRIEWQIERLVQSLFRWSQQGCPGLRTPFLNSLTSTEVRLTEDRA